MGTAITGSWRVSFKRDDTFSSGLSTDIAKSIEPRPANHSKDDAICEGIRLIQFTSSD